MTMLAVLNSNWLFRAALASLLRSLNFEDVVEAADAQELRQLVGSDLDPEILFVDISRRVPLTNDWILETTGLFPKSKIVILASDLDTDLLATSFASGASGYLLATISRDALEKSLTLVTTGAKVFPSELASLLSNLRAKSHEATNVATTPQHFGLSTRETEILGYLAQGQSNKAIAHMLDISEATVKVHVYRILRKIRATNRTKAALWAAANGLTAASASKSISGVARRGAIVS